MNPNRLPIPRHPNHDSNALQAFFGFSALFWATFLGVMTWVAR